MKFIKALSVLALTLLMVACGEKKSESSSTADATQAKIEEVKQPSAPTGPLAQFKFTEKEFDFGEITEGDKVTHVFNYTNEGEVPLTITNVRTTCGCTAPNWSREPLAPGESAELTVTFNSAHKKGTQVKRVTISANVEDGMDVVTIRAKVNPKEEKASM
ncbi:MULTISPECIES: DUF1573 domain-containing protein [unclassified Flammeovirga]|uniref:DUF1573 domain-containing protein n=1 Tax=unclassified Flammeovirga TaxID=2637820 RepID=UPI0005C4ED60|nr:MULTISPECIES: DUF1573 domain-containing protein [unclassified Flammeovirga]MBD0403371.1 DUF1573 domain-containing protein [Flammeovirga sp. EKP202]